MHPLQESLLQARRQFLTSFASGVGGLALASMLRDDGLVQAEPITRDPADPLSVQPPHFAPKAKNCIFIFLNGAPSQLDLYDPKPKLNELHGQKMPESLTKNVRFAFIQKDSAMLMGTKRKFTPHGECGMELSDLLPHLGEVADDLCLIRSMHTDEFNHHPGQLMMNTGIGRFGRPSMGSWLTYGLGSESRDLPGYVVLSAGRGASGGASLWSSGFLPSTYAGVLFRNQGDPILNLANPPGLTRDMQKAGLDALNQLNAERYETTGGDEINSRIAAYELAFRMQSAAPELIDLSSEGQETLDAYGVNRDGKVYAKMANRSGGPQDFRTFATNCLLARRMVERGVRFVNLYHASWDHHSKLDEGLTFNATMADQPIAALIKDLKQRGLLDETLVVVAGEFGRTPLGENRGGNPNASGRDHHPYAFSLFLAGGGIKGGYIHGKTDEIGWSPVENPVHIHDLHATMLHLFGLDHLKLTVPFKGLEVRLTDQGGKVVKDLIA